MDLTDFSDVAIAARLEQTFRDHPKHRHTLTTNVSPLGLPAPLEPAVGIGLPQSKPLRDLLQPKAGEEDTGIEDISSYHGVLPQHAELADKVLKQLKLDVLAQWGDASPELRQQLECMEIGLSSINSDRSAVVHGVVRVNDARALHDTLLPLMQHKPLNVQLEVFAEYPIGTAAPNQLFSVRGRLTPSPDDNELPSDSLLLRAALLRGVRSTLCDLVEEDDPSTHSKAMRMMLMAMEVRTVFSFGRPSARGAGAAAGDGAAPPAAHRNILSFLTTAEDRHAALFLRFPFNINMPGMRLPVSIQLWPEAPHPAKAHGRNRPPFYNDNPHGIAVAVRYIVYGAAATTYEHQMLPERPAYAATHSLADLLPTVLTALVTKGAIPEASADMLMERAIFPAPPPDAPVNSHTAFGYMIFAKPHMIPEQLPLLIDRDDCIGNRGQDWLSLTDARVVTNDIAVAVAVWPLPKAQKFVRAVGGVSAHVAGEPLQNTHPDIIARISGAPVKRATLVDPVGDNLPKPAARDPFATNAVRRGQRTRPPRNRKRTRPPGAGAPASRADAGHWRQQTRGDQPPGSEDDGRMDVDAVQSTSGNGADGNGDGGAASTAQEPPGTGTAAGGPSGAVASGQVGTGAAKRAAVGGARDEPPVE